MTNLQDKLFITSDTNVIECGEHTLNIDNIKYTEYKSFKFNYSSLNNVLSDVINNTNTEKILKDWYCYFKENINNELYNTYLQKYTNKTNIDNNFTNSSMDIIKYFDFDYWIKQKLRLFEFINKHINLQGKNVYDIGSGFGHFPLICKYYGSNIVVGSNIPYAPNSFHEGELYENICKSFNLETDYLRVNPNVSLELNMKYDIVSGLMPRWFHLFSLDEAKFFINDLKKNVLTKDGKIFLECNTPDKYEYLEKISQAFTQGSPGSSRFFLISN
jgi:hypothetical protein